MDNENGHMTDGAVQSWEMGDDPHVHLENLKFNYGLRRILFLIVLGGSLFSGTKLWPEISRYLRYGEPTDVGDIREIWATENEKKGNNACVKGCPDALKIKNGSFVRMTGFVPTMTRTDATNFNEFFCPLFNIVVQTSQTLPAPPMKINNLDGRFLGLISTKRARVENLDVKVTMQGLLYRREHAPSSMKDSLWTWEKGEYPRSVSWVLIDGFDPSFRTSVLWIYAGAIFLVISSLVFMLRSRRRYLNFRQYLNM
ncbi:MAG: hypothetical protein CMH54_01080 [Myxococcales bacterium]|mgnify:CR=1 FL=1|nr:hypothetical protein [Myxococcales bacterium]